MDGFTPATELSRHTMFSSGAWQIASVMELTVCKSGPDTAAHPCICALEINEVMSK